MLQGEHSAILSTFIKLLIVINNVVVSILGGHFLQVLLYMDDDGSVVQLCTCSCALLLNPLYTRNA